MKNKKGVELVTSPSLSCKTFFLFWSDPLNPETVERKGKKKKLAKYSISQEQKELFRGDKNHFS